MVIIFMNIELSTNNISITRHTISVLLVDDQPLINKAVKKMLENENDIRFHYCQYAHMAIRMANQVMPTIILQDLTMPDINGLELVQLFRINNNMKKVPLIVLSATEDAEVKAKAFELGANDYMVKFPDQQEVIARIRYHSSAYIHRLERDEAFEKIKKQTKDLELRNRFIKKTFGRYLSDDIVKNILDSPDGMELGGEKRKVSIMMTDIRGFTSLSERLMPEDVVTILNIYLKTMTKILFEFRGTIDEFIGDAILALFGAPITESNDADRAIACALKMQLYMNDVNNEILEHNYPEISMGIGINTGDVIVGNIGSDQRSKYAVIGKHVNLTARIESYTVGGQILVSESTIKSCNAKLRIDDELKVTPKGVKNSITIYEVGGIEEPFNIFLPEKQEENMIKLDKKLELSFIILENKDVGKNEYSGFIESLSQKSIVICSEENMKLFSNLKIKLFDEENDILINDIYGKISKKLTDSKFVVNLTSIPPDFEVLFNKYL
ncbi:adenylyl cyclase [Candidatus Magnetomorum sp. HK-1]|nr:adenylyl cyclase [Candidatus Magnetomorum sp. HK-1]